MPARSADPPTPSQTPRCRHCGHALMSTSMATDPVQRARMHGPGCPMGGTPSPQTTLATPQGGNPPLPSGQTGSSSVMVPGPWPWSAPVPSLGGMTTGQPGGAGAAGTGTGAAGTGTGAAGTGADATGAGAGTGAGGTGDTGPGAPGLGTDVSGQGGGRLTLFGDLSPLRGVRALPGPPPVGRFATRGVAPPSFVRGFKIADNQSVIPVDRLYYDFNFFDNVYSPVNLRAQNGIQRVQVYRHILGGEKTFFDGQASIGVRMPINTITADSPLGGVSTPTTTAVNNFNVYSKFLFYSDTATKTFVSGGLAMTIPSGPQNFAGSSYVRNFNNPELQPFIGFQKTWDRVYILGFEAINVPLNPRGVTTLYNDFAVGYFLYRATNRRDLIQGLAPTLEVHVNNPLNHRDVFNLKDKAGSADIVDFTSGLNVFFRNKVQLGMAVVTPVTGPRPFSIEALTFLNVFF